MAAYRHSSLQSDSRSHRHTAGARRIIRDGDSGVRLLRAASGDDWDAWKRADAWERANREALR